MYKNIYHNIRYIINYEIFESSETTLHFLQLTMPKVIFCNEESAGVVLDAVKEQNCKSTVVVFGKHVGAISFSDILNNCTDKEVANFRYGELDDLKKTACIMHSSGTTGLPKGVEASNYALLLLSNETMGLNYSSALWFSSLYWLTGIMMNFNAIVNGGRTILYPKFDEEITCQLIDKYKVILYCI